MTIVETPNKETQIKQRCDSERITTQYWQTDAS
jgi:hypothetical protein